jgi:NADPH:quinone reductase-like Zn-dependent oxidoreductase
MTTCKALVCEEIGNGLKLKEINEPKITNQFTVKVKVFYSGLNFADVLTISKKNN